METGEVPRNRAPHGESGTTSDELSQWPNNVPNDFQSESESKGDGNLERWLQPLVAHIRDTEGKKAFRCKVCGITFFHTFDITMHVQTHGLDNTSNNDPTKTVPPPQSVQHYQQHKTPALITTVAESWASTLPSPSSVAAKARAAVAAASAAVFPQQGGDGRRASKPRPYECLVCNRKFKLPKSLLNHISVFHPSRGNVPVARVPRELIPPSVYMRRRMKAQAAGSPNRLLTGPNRKSTSSVSNLMQPGDGMIDLSSATQRHTERRLDMPGGPQGSRSLSNNRLANEPAGMRHRRVFMEMASQRLLITHVSPPLLSPVDRTDLSHSSVSSSETMSELSSPSVSATSVFDQHAGTLVINESNDSENNNDTTDSVITPIDLSNRCGNASRKSADSPRHSIPERLSKDRLSVDSRTSNVNNGPALIPSSGYSSDADDIIMISPRQTQPQQSPPPLHYLQQSSALPTAHTLDMPTPPHLLEDFNPDDTEYLQQQNYLQQQDLHSQQMKQQKRHQLVPFDQKRSELTTFNEPLDSDQTPQISRDSMSCPMIQDELERQFHIELDYAELQLRRKYSALGLTCERMDRKKGSRL